MEVPDRASFEMARRHVQAGEKLIAKQKILIEQLAIDHHEELLPAAWRLLELLEQSQALHREHVAKEHRS